MRIFKYELYITDGVQELRLPKGAEILTVQVQAARLMFWAIVHPHFETEKRCFSVYGTGHEMNPTITHKYIATVQNFQLVWHIFEVVL
jgi:hypothetical protein